MKKRLLQNKMSSKVAIKSVLLEVLSTLLMIGEFNCDYIPKWSCDFENGLCHWLQVKDDQFDFRHVTGGDVGWKDHTTDSKNGKLLFLNTSDYPIQYMAAKIVSPVLMPNNGSCKMVLHYKIIQFNHKTLQICVNMVTKESSGKIHRKQLVQASNATSWKRMDVILQSNVEFQVEISGIIDDSKFGRIGIDDIWFAANCQTNEKSPIRLIKLWSSPSHNYPAGVLYENLNGSWSVICSEDSARSACNLLGLKDLSSVNSNTSFDHLKSGESFCLPRNITVPTLKSCNDESSCTNVTYWECKQDYISICPKLTHVACTSAVKYPVCVSNNQICDYYPNCPGGEDESDCLSYNRCDFQKDMCDWATANNTLFEWIRYYDSVRMQYYLKVDTRQAYYQNDYARLKFKYLIQGMENSTCSIRFTYKAYGLLRVFIEHNNSTEILWSVDSLGGSWHQEFVELPQNKSFQLFFDGFVIYDYIKIKYFALANVSFSKDCMFANHTHEYSRNDLSILVCHSGEAVDKMVVCDFQMDCFDGSDESNCSNVPERCSFESSFCNWQVGWEAPVQLRRWKGYTSSPYTGPSKDHTNKFKNGYYVYLEASGKEPGSFGYLISRIMQRSSKNKCTFRWFYHIWDDYNYGIGKLSIIYKDVLSQSERILWQLQGNQGNVWKYGSVTFYVTSSLYQIMIKIERGKSHRGDIAIDDVSFGTGCLPVQAMASITITKNGLCSAVKHIINGSRASIFQVGNGAALCTLSLKTDPKFRILLYAEFFSTASSAKVLINAGGNDSVIYGGEFSGSLKPFSLISSTNIITIKVPPMNGISSHAFTFNITSTNQLAHSAIYYRPSGSKRIDVIRDCKGIITRFTFMSHGTVKPRMQFSSYFTAYFRDERCIFRFLASNGYRIKFTFNKFETELKHDYIKILNYGTIGQAVFSGSLPPFRFISKRSHVEMLFVTDRYVQRSGFLLSVMATDENAMAPDLKAPISTKSTFYPWFSTTSFPRLRTGPRPVSFLKQTCGSQLQSQYAKGDYLFGGIDFYGKGGYTYGSVLDHCSWSGYGEASSKFMLEFQHIDTGSKYAYLRVNYETGKQRDFRGYLNVQNLDLLETGNQFKITIHFNSYSLSNIRIRYSRSPGCYKDTLRRHYTYNHAAGSYCYCEGYKYGFMDSNGHCYCGQYPPAYYGLFIRHPNNCSNCMMSCGHGKLFVHIDEYSEWLYEKEKLKNKTTPLITIIVSTVIVILALVIFGFMACICYRIKHRPSQSSRRTSLTDQAENQRDIGPCAYFVNAPPEEEMLPSYDDATKGRVFVFNTLHNSQNITQYGYQYTRPEFTHTLQDDANDRPPQYTDIIESSSQAMAGSIEIESGHTSANPDLPDIESSEWPISRE